MNSIPARADEPAATTAPDAEVVAAPEAPPLTFADFDVHADIVESLADAGITTPSRSRR